MEKIKIKIEELKILLETVLNNLDDINPENFDKKFGFTNECMEKAEMIKLELKNNYPAEYLKEF